MNYEIINLQKKDIVGITARTRNDDEKMGEIIGGLWSDLFNKGVLQNIGDKINNCTIGLYSGYENDEKSEYSITVGCEVKNITNIPRGTVVKNIPEGKYAKFIVEGNMQTAVQEFWDKLWQMPLDRKYSGDFEEYQPECTMKHAIIHIYISIT